MAMAVGRKQADECVPYVIMTATGGGPGGHQKRMTENPLASPMVQGVPLLVGMATQATQGAPTASRQSQQPYTRGVVAGTSRVSRLGGAGLWKGTKTVQSYMAFPRVERGPPGPPAPNRHSSLFPICPSTRPSLTQWDRH